MANTRTNSRSFSGGEVTPEFFGQITDGKFQTGLALCRNFEVLPHGPVQNRAGFGFVRAARLGASGRARLIPFTYSTTQTMVLEFTQGGIRFHTQGATLMNGGVPYEVATPYQDAHLFDIHYVQSADVLTLVHPAYPPMELRRLGALNWVLTTIAFATSLQPPANVVATATPGTTPSAFTTYVYAVTTVGDTGLDESLVSASASCDNNLLDTGAKNVVTWDAATDARRYNVYKRSNGLWGYIGQADGLSFTDDNITADVGKTPPEANNPFSGVGNYPGAVSYYEQRRVFAGSTNRPQNIWGTRSGTESNMTFSIPSQDADAINIRVVAREANTVRHLVPLNNLIALTSSAEWRVGQVGGADPLTPTNTPVKPQSYIGSNNVQPQVVNNNLLYPAARGGHLRELAYNFNANGYVTGDLSLRAPHLFDTMTIVDMMACKAPQPMIWCVSSSGKLLGLTYVPEQQVGAWHQHDTDGLFESVATVAEGDEDILYAVVRRVVNGQAVRYIERKRSRVFVQKSDAFFVDSGLTYQGAPVTTLSGLGHLEGKTVSVLADGAVAPQRVVVSGQITLDEPASTIHVGLPITADMQTLPMAIEVAGFGQGRVKNVNKAFPRVYRSSGIFAGPSFDRLREFKQRTTEPYGTSPRLRTEELEIVVDPDWQDGGHVCLRQLDPLPLTVVSLTIDVAIGG